MIEPPIAFLPSLASLTSELLAKVLTNKRMAIETLRIVWIFPGKQSCSS
jgi:hypothetical protein